MNKYFNKLICILILTGLSSPTFAEQRLRMATTTSTDNSGLLAVLNPVFEKDSGMILDVIPVGTGKALKLAENGDVDLILVHAPGAEKEFVAAGFGVDRKAVMHNDFVIIGPKSDPAELSSAKNAAEALRRIQQHEATFISRGDDSGTHKKEISLWQTAGVEPVGNWYLAVGQGMGAVLKITNDKQAYTLSDRGTWLAFKSKLDLDVVSQGDPALFNPYHVIIVNPERHPHTKYQQATRYSDFITGQEGQEIIQNFKVNGEVLFHPDAL